MADFAPATYPARCKMAASSTAARFPDNYCLCTRQFPWVRVRLLPRISPSAHSYGLAPLFPSGTKQNPTRWGENLGGPWLDRLLSEGDESPDRRPFGAPHASTPVFPLPDPRPTPERPSTAVDQLRSWNAELDSRHPTPDPVRDAVVRPYQGYLETQESLGAAAPPTGSTTRTRKSSNGGCAGPGRPNARWSCGRPAGVR